MPRSDTSPNQITAARKTAQVNITWNDGHVSQIPFSLLRAACPCAGCRGGHEYMVSEPDDAMFAAQLPDSPATRMKSVQPVGSYAVSFEWEDGHSSGIYTWHYLRALCTCPECQKVRMHGG